MIGVYEFWTWDVNGYPVRSTYKVESHQAALDAAIADMLRLDEGIYYIGDRETLEYVRENASWGRLRDSRDSTLATTVEVYELEAPLDFDPDEFYPKKSYVTLEVDVEASLWRRNMITTYLLVDECDDEEKG